MIDVLRQRVDMIVPTQDPTGERVLRCVRRYGRHSSSFQVLGSGYEYWFDDDDDDDDGDEACVAYRRVGTTRVVAGPPLAPASRMSSIVDRFAAATRAVGDRAVLFGVDARFLDQVRGHECELDALHVGSEPTWDVSNYSLVGSRYRSLRSQIRRSQRNGITIRRLDPVEYGTEQAPARKRVQRLIRTWQDTRKLEVMDFLVRVEPFSYPGERRLYVAERGVELCGFLMAVPMYGADGWFIEDVIRHPGAPQGTTEALIAAAMRDAHQAGHSEVSLGLVPLADVRGGEGAHRWLRALLRGCYANLETLYRFRGLHAFKARLRPDAWHAQYIVSLDGRVGLGAITSVLRAFSGGSLWAFSVATVRRHLPGWRWGGGTQQVGTRMTPQVLRTR
ncbi:MAG: DUF2156 domain-containing protein [Nannocystaceae bacterium]